MISSDTPLNLALDALVDALHQALKHPERADSDHLLRKLLLFRMHSQALPPPLTDQQVIRQVVAEALKILMTQDKELAQVLEMRFIEEKSVQLVAHNQHKSVAAINRDQQKALKQLAQIVQTQEMAARTEVIKEYQLRIKFPVAEKLFGIEDQVKTLLRLLQQPDGPSLILLEGMGGIGKTSLAAALLVQAIGSSLFKGYGWVSAQQRRLLVYGAIQPFAPVTLSVELLLKELWSQLLPGQVQPTPFTTDKAQLALAKYFQQSPALIVIDNLETMEDLLDLLPILQSFRNHARFILTSRHSIKSDYAVYTYSVPPLQETEALQLIRWEALQRNLPHAAQASDTELGSIYTLIGGNPLALRLVTAQLQTYDLSMVLENLSMARTKATEALYTYLYEYIWDKLEESTSHLWLAMQLVPQEGETLERIVQITRMDAKTVINAIETLVTFNLVNRIHGQRESRYTIHPLTRTFLHYKSQPG
jgi:hypothetical protein